MHYMTRQKLLLALIVLFILFGASLILFAFIWSEVGSWYGSVNGRFSSGPETNHHIFYFVMFEGRTIPKWRLMRPNNFRYTFLSLQVKSDAGTKRAELDVPSMRYTTEREFGSLSTDTLLAWVGAPENAQHVSTLKHELNWVLDLMRSAGTSNLPPTRHHPRFYDSPVSGHLTHFSCGWRAAPIATLLGFFCIAIAAVLYFSLRRHKTVAA